MRTSILRCLLLFILLLSIKINLWALPVGYVANYGSDSVSLFNISTRSEIKQIDVGTNPHGTWLSNDQKYLYVANTGSHSISVIDTDTNTKIQDISVGNSPVELLSSNGYIYTANSGDNTVSIIDESTLTLISTINAGTRPEGIERSSDESRVYVSNSLSMNISVIDTSTNSVISTIPIGTDAHNLRVSKDGSKLYITAPTDHKVVIVDTVSNTKSGEIVLSNSSNPVEILTFNDFIYVTTTGDGTLYKIDADTNEIIDQVKIGTDLHGLYPYSRQKLVISHSSDNSMALVDSNLMVVIGNIAVGNEPRGDAVITELTMKAHGSAVQFNGAGKINAGTIPDLSNSAAFTIEAWVNPNSYSQYDSIFQIYDPSDTSKHLNIQMNSNKWEAVIANSDQSLYSYAHPDTQTIDFDTWHHIAVVYDGGADSNATRVKMYINGALQSLTFNTSVPTVTPDLSDKNISLGQFEGMLDEFRVWSIARSESEIVSNMNHQLEGNESGLAAYYNFDEKMGDNIYDITSNNYSGAIEGDVLRLNFLNSNLEFDGTDDKIVVPYNSSLDLNSSFTLNAWVNFNKTSSMIFDKGSGNVDGYELKIGTTNKLQLKIIKDDSTLLTFDGLTTLAQNEFMYVSAVYDGSDIKLYVNGELDYNETIGAITLKTSTSDLAIGQRVDAASSFFGGIIAEASIFNTPLDQDEIKKYMYSSLDAGVNGLAGYWPLNEASGLNVNDRSQNSNNGTISGAIWSNDYPEIYGNSIYTMEGIISSHYLTVENNTSMPAYSNESPVNPNVTLESTSGYFTYDANQSGEDNTTFSVLAGANAFLNVYFNIYGSNISTSGDLNITDWEQLVPNNIPARHYHSVVEFNNELYFIGGVDGSSSYADVYKSDDGKNWSSASTADLPMNVSGHNSYIFDNTLFVASDTVLYYTNDSAVSWNTYGSSIPAIVGTHQTKILEFNNELWALGAKDGNNTTLIHKSTDGYTWNLITSGTHFTPRNNHGAVIFNNKMWVIGGFHSSEEGNSTHKSDIWSSSDGENWTQELAVAPFGARENFGAFVYDDKMWVMGGLEGITDTEKSDLWYSNDGINWTQSSISPDFLPREAYALLPFNNKIHLFGGHYYDNGTDYFYDDVWTFGSSIITIGLNLSNVNLNENNITAITLIGQDGIDQNYTFDITGISNNDNNFSVTITQEGNYTIVFTDEEGIWWYGNVSDGKLYDQSDGSSGFKSELSSSNSVYDFDLLLSNWVDTASNEAPVILGSSNISAKYVEIEKLIPSVSVTDGYFGIGAIDHENSVITAMGENSNTGAAYFYNIDQNGYIFNEAGRFEGSGLSTNHAFGDSVAIEGDYAIIGSSYAPNASSGSVFFYKKGSDGNFSEIAKFSISNGYFGSDVAIYEDYAAVSSRSESYSGGTNRGVVYIYKKGIDGNFTQVQRLGSPNEVDHGNFGSGLSFEGDYLVIGALQEEPDASYNDEGAAHIYKIDANGDYNHLTRIIASDPSESAYFGNSVAMSGEYIAIGSRGVDSVYLFKNDGADNFTQIAKLTGLDSVSGDNFGSSLAFEDHFLFIGADAKDTYTGAVYIFRKGVDGNFTQVDKLNASDSAINTNFAYNLSAYNNKLLVSSHGDDSISSNGGSAYLFERIYELNATQGESIGFDVNISDDTILLSDLNITITSSDQTIVSDTNFTFSDNGGLKYIEFTPESIGDVNVTLWVDDGDMISYQKFQLYVQEDTSGLIKLNLSNVNLDEHNITMISLIGQDGIDENISFNISDITSGSDNNFTTQITSEGNYTIIFIDEENIVWYGNVVDGKLYNENNGSSEFISNLSGSNLIYDFDLSAVNWIDTTAIILTHNGITYGTVVSPYTGKRWLDRNLGAGKVCTSYNDSGCYGYYYQWGREHDGHQFSYSTKASGTHTDKIINVGSSFMVNYIYPPDSRNNDWTTADSGGAIRAQMWSSTDGSSICPVGFRVPSLSEIQAETTSQGVSNLYDAFNGFLKLPASGNRHVDSGNLATQGSQLYLWTNSTGTSAQVFRAYTTSASSGTYYHSYGFNVRCIEDSTTTYVPHNGHQYGEVVSSLTGQTWLDRNLGAQRVCVDINDTACFGDYYQWGREDDGHQFSDSNTTTTQAATIENLGHNDFIKSAGTDWTSADSNGSLRAAIWEDINDNRVCPIGYRVPDIEEIEAEMVSVNNNSQSYSSILKIPSAGMRYYNTGTLTDQGTISYLWSNSVLGTSSIYYYSNSIDSYRYNDDRAFGVPIRCIKGSRQISSNIDLSDITESSLLIAISLIADDGNITLSPIADTTITLSQTIDIDKDINIVNNTAYKVTLDGNNLNRVVNIISNKNVSLKGMIIQNGLSSDSNGAGIQNSGILSLENMIIRNNSAQNGGGVYNSGIVYMKSSSIYDNNATNNGGGVYNDGNLSIINSTLGKNIAYSDGGAIYQNSGTLNISHTTIAYNQSDMGQVSAQLSGTATLNEGSIATYTVTLSRILDSNISFDINTTNGSAYLGTDFNAPVPNPLIIQGGEIEGNFTIQTFSNTVFDGGNEFNVTILNPTGNYSGSVDITTPTVSTFIDNTDTASCSDDISGCSDYNECTSNGYTNTQCYNDMGCPSGENWDGSDCAVSESPPPSCDTDPSICMDHAECMTYHDQITCDAEFPGGQASGGGIYNFSGSINIKNSIIINNTDAADHAPNIYGSINSHGNNIFGLIDADGDIVQISGNDEINITSSVIEDLNTSQTLPLFAISVDSIAIDGGTCLDLEGITVTTDQIGNSRPYGDSCDIGSYETTLSLPPTFEINLANHVSTDHNITKIEVIGMNGNTEVFDISTNYSYTSGDHNLSAPVTNYGGYFAIRVTLDDGKTYWYNFNDQNLYMMMDNPDDFITIIDDAFNIMTIDFNTTNFQVIRNYGFDTASHLPYIQEYIDSSTYSAATAYYLDTMMFGVEVHGNEDNGSEINIMQIAMAGDKIHENEIDVNSSGYVKDIFAEVASYDSSTNIGTIVDNGAVVANVKYLGDSNLSQTQLTALYNSIDKNITFPSGSVGYIVYEEFTADECEIWNDSMAPTYDSVDKFVTDHVFGTGYGFIKANEYNSSKVLMFESNTTNNVLEVNTITGDNSIVGTYSTQNSVSCSQEDHSSNTDTIVTVDTMIRFTFNTPSDGDGYQDGVVHFINGTVTGGQFNTAGDYRKTYLLNDVAAKHLVSQFGISSPYVFKVQKELSAGDNYLSLPTTMRLCTSTFQGLLTDFCDQDHTIDSVFSSVDKVLKHTGAWSYWEPSSTGTYNMPRLTSINHKEGLMVMSSSAQTIELPYDIFNNKPEGKLNIYNTGWFLGSVNHKADNAMVSQMVSDKGKRLRYILNYKSNAWNVYAPINDSAVDSTLPRMEYVDMFDSFWIYTE